MKNYRPVSQLPNYLKEISTMKFLLTNTVSHIYLVLEKGIVQNNA